MIPVIRQLTLLLNLNRRLTTKKPITTAKATMTISRFRAKKISAILDVAMNFFKVSRCLSGCLSQVHEFIQNTLMEWKKRIAWLSS